MRPDLQKAPALPDTLTPSDQLLAAGLGVGAAASGLVWATGQLGRIIGNVAVALLGAGGVHDGDLRALATKLGVLMRGCGTPETCLAGLLLPAAPVDGHRSVL